MHCGLPPAVLGTADSILEFLRDQRGVGEMKTGHVKMLSLLYTRRLRQFGCCGVFVNSAPRGNTVCVLCTHVGVGDILSLISLQIRLLHTAIQTRVSRKGFFKDFLHVIITY